MKWKFLSIFTVLLFTLMACQSGDNTQRDTDNPNVDPTSYRSHDDNNARDGERMVKDRDHTLKRDADRYQDRDNNDRVNHRQDNSNYDVAKEAADKITDEVAEIDRAFVITTDNNAYVAANLDADHRNNMNNRDDNANDRHRGDNVNHRDANELTDEVKDRISKVVKSVDGDIDNVYVSTNPDFLNLANDYADDVEQGEPIEGFFDQFGSMIERLFPENRQ